MFKLCFVFPWLIAFFLAGQSATWVVEELEKKLDSIKSLEAEFIHIYLPTHQTRGLEEKGRVYYQKPDLMRWDYLLPEKKTFLLQGQLIISFFPEDKQVIKRFLTDEEIKNTILGLISGQTKLQDLYTAQLLPELTDQSTFTLRLNPYESGEISYLLLEIDRRLWLIQKLSLIETQGQRQEYRFSRYRLNRPLAASMFELKIPPDWEIIEEAPPGKKK